MTTSPSWQPNASLAALQARASLLADIRRFFAQQNVLEVDTQILSQGTVTDVYLDGFVTSFDFSSCGHTQSLYLQTSPEFAMKRLLAAYKTCIYQLGKAFRHEGQGRWHNPEFTMLEWYRVGFDHHQLMDELNQLLMLTLATPSAKKMTYQDAFESTLGFDPLTCSDDTLDQAMQQQQIDLYSSHIHRDDKLQLLFGKAIEPIIGQDRPCFVYGFPASQASLAQLNASDPRIADRFELYFKGAELANGFRELQNADEQLARFEQDNYQRKAQGLPQKPIDRYFIAALEHGLPACAGVAMGIDRLLMLKLGEEHISQVMPFTIERA